MHGESGMHQESLALECKANSSHILPYFTTNNNVKPEIKKKVQVNVQNSLRHAKLKCIISSKLAGDSG
jgi:hypothetical protein